MTEPRHPYKVHMKWWSWLTKPWWFTQSWGREKLAKYLGETPDYTWEVGRPYYSTRGWNIAASIGPRSFDISPWGTITDIQPQPQPAISQLEVVPGHFHAHGAAEFVEKAFNIQYNDSWRISDAVWSENRLDKLPRGGVVYSVGSGTEVPPAGWYRDIRVGRLIFRSMADFYVYQIR